MGLNALHGSVLGRMREMAMLQTIGFSRRASVLSVMQEGIMLSMAAALLASLLAVLLVHGVAISFTVGAFQLRIDGFTLLIGNSIALFLGIAGTLPPACAIFERP